MRAASFPALLAGIVNDTGDLIGAHVASIRHDVTDGLGELRTYARAVLLAMAAITVALGAITVSLGLSLAEAGVPMWIASWIVTGVDLVLAYALIRRLKRSKSS